MTAPPVRKHPLTPTALRQVAIAERDGGWFCNYCRCRLAKADWSEGVRIVLGGFAPMIGYEWPIAEHVVPRCRGGSNDLSNLVLSCSRCNSKKGTRLLSELTEGWWK